MATTLDFRQPTVVIAGHWNNAILNEPAWVVEHILGVAEGTEVSLQQIVVENHAGPNQFAPRKQIWVYEGFGICCTGQRLEVYVRDADQLQNAYGVINTISQKLPHTPVTALGVNFHFLVEGEIAATTALFETHEALDAVGTIRSQERTDTLEIPNASLIDYGPSGKPPVLMKLSRHTDFKNVHLDLNYHQELPGIHMLGSWTAASPIAHWREHADELLRNCYDIEQINPVYF